MCDILFISKLKVKQQSIYGFILYFSATFIMAAYLYYLYFSKQINNNYADDFLIAYFIELSLSIDNVFVFMMIFKHLNITSPARVLKIGIISAIIMRFFVIIVGAKVFLLFKWVFYIFGVFLILTGIKTFLNNPKTKNTQRAWYYKFFKKTKSNLFFENYKPTVNLLALILVEKADLLFALDSIPAIIAITQDTFIIFTANVLAIIGLRVIFNLLIILANKLKYLKYGIAFMLILIGIKLMCIPSNIHINKTLFFIALLFSIIIPILLPKILKK
jgi:tellurite resistance protein TerC